MTEQRNAEKDLDFDFDKPTCACLRGTECEAHPAENGPPATWGGLVESASNCAYCAAFPSLPCAIHRPILPAESGGAQ